MEDDIPFNALGLAGPFTPESNPDETRRTSELDRLLQQPSPEPSPPSPARPSSCRLRLAREAAETARRWHPIAAPDMHPLLKSAYGQQDLQAAVQDLLYLLACCLQQASFQPGRAKRHDARAAAYMLLCAHNNKFSSRATVYLPGTEEFVREQLTPSDGTKVTCTPLDLKCSWSSENHTHPTPDAPIAAYILATPGEEEAKEGHGGHENCPWDKLLRALCPDAPSIKTEAESSCLQYMPDRATIDALFPLQSALFTSHALRFRPEAKRLLRSACAALPRWTHGPADAGGEGPGTEGEGADTGGPPAHYSTFLVPRGDPYRAHSAQAFEEVTHTPLATNDLVVTVCLQVNMRPAAGCFSVTDKERSACVQVMKRGLDVLATFLRHDATQIGQDESTTLPFFAEWLERRALLVLVPLLEALQVRARAQPTLLLHAFHATSRTCLSLYSSDTARAFVHGDSAALYVSPPIQVHAGLTAVLSRHATVHLTAASVLRRRYSPAGFLQHQRHSWAATVKTEGPTSPKFLTTDSEAYRHLLRCIRILECSAKVEVRAAAWKVLDRQYARALFAKAHVDQLSDNPVVPRDSTAKNTTPPDTLLGPTGIGVRQAPCILTSTSAAREMLLREALSAPYSYRLRPDSSRWAHASPALLSNSLHRVQRLGERWLQVSELDSSRTEQDTVPFTPSGISLPGAVCARQYLTTFFQRAVCSSPEALRELYTRQETSLHAQDDPSRRRAADRANASLSYLTVYGMHAMEERYSTVWAEEDRELACNNPDLPMFTAKAELSAHNVSARGWCMLPPATFTPDLDVSKPLTEHTACLAELTEYYRQFIDRALLGHVLFAEVTAVLALGSRRFTCHPSLRHGLCIHLRTALAPYTVAFPRVCLYHLPRSRGPAPQTNKDDSVHSSDSQLFEIGSVPGLNPAVSTAFSPLSPVPEESFDYSRSTATSPAPGDTVGAASAAAAAATAVYVSPARNPGNTSRASIATTVASDPDRSRASSDADYSASDWSGSSGSSTPSTRRSTGTIPHLPPPRRTTPPAASTEPPGVNQLAPFQVYVDARPYRPPCPDAPRTPTTQSWSSVRAEQIHRLARVFRASPFFSGVEFDRVACGNNANTAQRAEGAEDEGEDEGKGEDDNATVIEAGAYRTKHTVEPFFTESQPLEWWCLFSTSRAPEWNDRAGEVQAPRGKNELPLDAPDDARFRLVPPTDWTMPWLSLKRPGHYRVVAVRRGDGAPLDTSEHDAATFTTRDRRSNRELCCSILYVRIR